MGMCGGVCFAVVASFYITRKKVVASSYVRPDQRVVLSVRRNIKYQLLSVLFNLSTSAAVTPPHSIPFSSRPRCCQSVVVFTTITTQQEVNGRWWGTESRGRLCGEMGFLSRGWRWRWGIWMYFMDGGPVSSLVYSCPPRRGKMDE